MPVSEVNGTPFTVSEGKFLETPGNGVKSNMHTTVAVDLQTLNRTVTVFMLKTEASLCRAHSLKMHKSQHLPVTWHGNHNGFYIFCRLI